MVAHLIADSQAMVDVSEAVVPASQLKVYRSHAPRYDIT